MSGIVIIDEKGSILGGEHGCPHATVLLHFDPPQRLKWLGFYPNGELWGKTGVIADDARESFIDNYIRFDVAEDRLKLVLTKLVPTYQGKTYNLGQCDCVSFAADACRTAGLAIPFWNITPGGFVWWLKTFRSDYTHYNAKPYPWKAAETPPVPAEGRTHTVKPGDTLSKIAFKWYGRPDQWDKIYHVNRKLIGPDPAVIRPGQQLNIP